MRFPIASLVLVAVAFILLISYLVGSFILHEFGSELNTHANNTMGSYEEGMFNNEVSLLINGFGFVSLLLFIIAGVVYLVDCFRKESEYYERY